MQRNAFLMYLKPGNEAEYKRRHDQIWPELEAELTAAGISDYSIYLDRRTGTLFAVQKLRDGHRADDLPNHPVVQKWWEYMKDLMETNPDNSPVTTGVEEVFHLE